MNKTNTLIRIIVVSIGLSLAACSEKVEIAKIFDACKSGGIVIIQGYIIDDTTSCSPGTSGNRECSLILNENSEGIEQEIYFTLVEGRNANQVETSEVDAKKTKSSSSFAMEDIKIRGDNGSIINLQEKVLVIGKTELILSSSGVAVCSMVVKKIEQ